jgi:hypothetical protein
MHYNNLEELIIPIDILIKSAKIRCQHKMIAKINIVQPDVVTSSVESTKRSCGLDLCSPSQHSPEVVESYSGEWELDKLMGNKER